MSFVVILDAALTAVLIGFNGWNWFLAMSGYSTIEFWGKQTRVSIIIDCHNFSFREEFKNMTIVSRVLEITFTRHLEHTT